ncbi:hypothetical protein ACFP3U_04960 [Kitasatospora misakiensis]|uniref:Tetratricopeptide repeat protein n=1 Tax=Kitasatospora misakiensis TaxID=67330 RepID=A0ABW0WXP6_9ACTN
MEYTARAVDFYVRSGRPESAKALALSRATKGMPGANLLVADLLADVMDDRESAESFYRAALAEGDVEAYNNFGCFLSDEDRADEAEEVFLRGVAEGDALSMENLGKHYFDLGENGSAIPALRQAVDAGRENALAFLARAEARAGCTEDARRHAHEAVDRDVPSAHLALAESLAAEPAEADSVIDESYTRALRSEDDGAPFSYARWLHDVGRLEEALALYRRAADEGELHALLNMGLVLDLLGDSDEALAAYRRGAEAGDLESAAELARALEEAEREDRADRPTGESEA